MSLWTPNQRTLTKTDHDHIVALGKGVNSVLEFGPGYSTFAWIEAGVPTIVGLEHDDKWFDVQTERFTDYPQVKIDKYWNEAPAARVPEGLGDFDIAFVDSPKGYIGGRAQLPGQEDCSRLNTCLAALMHAPVVYLHDAIRPLERASLTRLEALGHKVEWVAAPVKWKQQDDSYGLARIVRDGKNQSRTNLQDTSQPWRPADGPGCPG
jgi:hypothetical protein